MKKFPACLMNEYLPTLFFVFLVLPMQTLETETLCPLSHLGGGRKGDWAGLGWAGLRSALWTI